MLIKSLLLLCFTSIFATTASANASSKNADAGVFRLTLNAEPTHLDPQKQRTPNSSYVIHNLHRSLFKYHTTEGLSYDLAEKCERKKKQLLCSLRKDARWSNGEPITSADFVRAFHFLVDPQNANPQADFILSLKNAAQILQKKMPVTSLGVQTPNSQQLVFTFAEDDADFEYKLTSSLLSPRAASSDLYSGPYQLEKWTSGKHLLLSPQPHYVQGAKDRPSLQFYFVEEDSVALKLYQQKQLDFVRRLPTLYIPTYKNKSDFYFIPVLRFDYFAFGPALDGEPSLRKAITESLHYEELQKIFHSPGRPGCPGLGAEFFPEKADLNKICYFKNNSLQSGAVSGVVSGVISAEKLKNIDFELVTSSQGGDDHKRASEWIQNQLQKNLKISLRTKSLENKVFLQQLAQRPPALYRKGHSLDRPTCLAALEIFENTALNQNPVKIKTDRFEKTLHKMRKGLINKTEQKDLCYNGVLEIMQNHSLIPTGPMHFALLANPRFTGWHLNSMNQLDLAGLRKADR